MNWKQLNPSLFVQENASIAEKYPKLFFQENEGEITLSGTFEFCAVFGERQLQESFRIEIVYPDNFPHMIPVVFEKANRLPKDYHRNPNGTLCLGAYTELALKFFPKPNTINFLESLLIPYLYRFCIAEIDGIPPFEDLSHGAKGLFEYFNIYFGVNSEIAVYHLLGIAAQDRYRGHTHCPCNCGKRLRNCHGKLVQNLSTVPIEYLVHDYTIMKNHLRGYNNSASTLK